MKGSRIGPWLAVIIGTIYFLVPLIATFEFSLRLRRGEYSFDAYRIVLADPRFQATFGYSTLVAIATILLGVLLVVPTAYGLTGSSLNLVPILLFAQIRGDVLHDPHLGYALALGMILITGLSNGVYIVLRSRSERWLK